MAVAQRYVTPSSASSSVATMRAFSSTSLAPLARCTVSARSSTSGQRGATSTRSSNPMTFIARAAAPTLPAWLVLIRMKRVRMGLDCLSPAERADRRARRPGAQQPRRASLVGEANQDVIGAELLAGRDRDLFDDAGRRGCHFEA